jgi:hypothetical protein
MLCKGFGLKWHDQLLVSVIAERNTHSDQVDYNVRLLEAETAMAYGIQFDDSWYGIPELTRATMIAARLGRQWLDSLQSEELAHANSSKGVKIG